jgi:putative transposase
MTNTTPATCLPPLPNLEMAWRDVDSSFERFCLTAGIGAIEQILREDAQQPPARGTAAAEAVCRPPLGPRLRARSAATAARLRCIDRGYAASTARKLRWRPGRRRRPRTERVDAQAQAPVPLPEGDLPVLAGDGTSKSAASRRFVALSAERLAA